MRSERAAAPSGTARLGSARLQPGYGALRRVTSCPSGFRAAFEMFLSRTSAHRVKQSLAAPAGPHLQQEPPHPSKPGSVAFCCHKAESVLRGGSGEIWRQAGGDGALCSFPPPTTQASPSPSPSPSPFPSPSPSLPPSPSPSQPSACPGSSSPYYPPALRLLRPSL